MSSTSAAKSKRTHSTARLRALVAALVFACFVAAETFAAVHVLDDAAHTGSEPCNICVGSASFAAAATAAPLAAALVFSPPSALAAPAPRAAAARGFPLRPPSRAPPVVP
jgi:hypothetical protein